MEASPDILTVSLRRSVEQFLRPDDTVKVKILEGARAAGKTTVALRLLASGHYDRMVSLADPDTLARAKADIQLFVDDLGNRAIVDEAQLLADDLSLAIKGVVDHPGSSRRFLLTGSARIARTGLGGADPLAGRAERWTLDPLSATEIRGDPNSLTRMIDGLFGPTPGDEVARIWPTHPADEWMSTGGMPTWAIGAVSDARRQQIASAWRESVLTEHILPDEGRFDLAGATRVLDNLLRTPATSLNVTALAQRLEMDPRTVSRYIDVFERRFMLRLLPNLALNPARQTRRGAKIHAIDLSLARQALAGADPSALTRADTTGALFETWVVNQALAARPLAQQQVSAFSWRTSRGEHEVDLVLAAADGRQVGIEVKSSTTIHPKDARGLRAFAESAKMHAGYVVYSGSDLIRLGERIWALPVSAYLEGWQSAKNIQAVQPPKKDLVTTGPSLPQGTDGDTSEIAATIFVSYVRDDNKFLNGAIVDFADDLADAYHFTYGRKLGVFTDELSVRWGEDWQQRLTAEIEKTSFLLANVTPRYLINKNCRDEITRFDVAARAAGVPKLVLPVIWSSINGLGIVDEQDPVLRLVTSHQWEETSDLAGLERGSAPYKERLRQIAGRLHDTITYLESIQPAAPAATTTETEEERGAVEAFGELGPAADEFASALNDIMNSLTPVLEGLDLGKPNGSQLASARHKLDPKVRRLAEATGALDAVWNESTRLFSDSTLGPVLRSMIGREQLLGLAVQLEIPDRDQVIYLLDILGRMSRMLRPSTSAITKAIRVVDSIRTSAEAWGEEPT